MRSAALALVAAIALPTFGAAQEPIRAGQTYVVVKLGAIVPQHDDVEYFDNGFALEGAVGFLANQNIALELAVGRFAISATQTAVVSGIVVTATEDVVAYPVTATVKLIAPIDKVQLFGLVGGGLYFMSDDVKATAPGYVPITDSDTDSPFALHFGGGLNIRLSPAALLGAEVKYIVGTAKMWDSSNHFDSVMLGGGLTFLL